MNLTQLGNWNHENKIVDKDLIYVRKKDKKDKLKVYNFARVKNLWNMSELKKKAMNQINLTINDFTKSQLKLKNEEKAKCKNFLIKSEKNDESLVAGFKINNFIKNQTFPFQTNKRNLKTCSPIERIKRLDTAEFIDEINDNPLSNVIQ